MFVKVLDINARTTIINTDGINNVIKYLSPSNTFVEVTMDHGGVVKLKEADWMKIEQKLNNIGELTSLL